MSSYPIERPICPCPSCGADMAAFAFVVVTGGVRAGDDPGGEARLDLTITCEECKGAFNVFVPLSDMQPVLSP